jgi:transposase
MMVTIAWNPLGFRLLDALPQGNTFNAEYYRVTILRELPPLHPQVDGRRLVIHADNARPHIARKCRVFCEGNRLRLVVHQPCSLDLIPFDFFLFAYIKRCLRGTAFPSREELLAAIHEIVGAVPQATLDDMLRPWMERLKSVSQNNGDHYL